MFRIAFLITLLLAGAAAAQSPPAPASAPVATPMYPAPPPLQAPTVQQGVPTTGLSSPLVDGQPKIVRTEINSETEAALLGAVNKLIWGRYAKIKGAKPGEVAVTQQNGLWTIKGRIDSVAPGTEGDWASIDGVVERISAGHVQIRGEVAFRLAKVQKGTPCKVGGTLNFRRSGKSQTWRLTEGDNPCDGMQELFDLQYEKAADKRPVPAQQPVATPGKRT